MVKHYALTTPAPPPTSQIPYSSALNDEQRAAVFAGAGPVLILAGAGTGKTRTLVYRVARLIELGTPPERILLVTFTNKAARSMLGRVAELLPLAARRVWGGTFHHVCNRLLREHGSVIGYEPNFTILDPEDARDMMETVLAEAGAPSQPKRVPKADVLLDLMSFAINTQRPLAEIIAERAPYHLPVVELANAVARQYMVRKHRANAMDFDDLLLNAKLILTEFPEAAAVLRRRFDHVLADEFQDTNRLQGDLVDLLAAEHKNLTAVGDDAQSIYAFRGADYTNITGFPERYPGCQIFKLTINYRSTPEILRLANVSIAHNRAQFAKELRTLKDSGTLPGLVPLRDVYQQAQFVAQRILDLQDEGYGLDGIAILYRSHAHSMELQVELTRRGIPFRVRSGVRFFEQAHIKDVLAFLRFVRNPADDMPFRRALKLFPGIGGALAEKFWRAIEGKGEVPACFAGIQPETVGGQRAAKGWESFTALVSGIAGTPRAGEMPGVKIRFILNDFYRGYLQAKYPEARDRIEDIEQLAEFADRYPSIEAFLDELALIQEIAAEELAAGEPAQEMVTLSSVHQAKGLEWRAVFVIWLADGRFPSTLALKDPGGEEEERRLFYVACTRAQDELTLTYPAVHLSRDYALTLMQPSRFVTEIAGTAPPIWERWEVEAAPAEATAGVLASGQPPALKGGPGPNN